MSPNPVSQALAQGAAHGVTVAEWVLMRQLADRRGMTRGAIRKLAEEATRLSAIGHPSADLPRPEWKPRQNVNAAVASARTGLAGGA